MADDSQYKILAYYHFTPLEHPDAEVQRHHAFFAGRDVTARIYITHEGINGQMSAIAEDAEAYMAWMHEQKAFQDVHFKVHPYHEHVFPRCSVKRREQLVAFDTDASAADGGEHVSPKQWREMLESDKRPLLLDVRNDYEWEVGHFEGAESPPCATSRDFTTFADTLKEKHNPTETPVMMYCTGGIRCEIYSALLKNKGFKNVYQLQGGVINYGLEEGSKHWRGKLFVFDDRMTIPISDGEETPTVGKCTFCKEPADDYYNCANMDCNKLFLSCPSCSEEYLGCCTTPCHSSTNVRPYHHQNAHKPFRKWHHYFEEKRQKKKERRGAEVA